MHETATNKTRQSRPVIPMQPKAPAREDLPMNLLAAGIPLTLLLDLAENFGPPSSEILATEHADDDTFLGAPRAEG